MLPPLPPLPPPLHLLIGLHVSTPSSPAWSPWNDRCCRYLLQSQGNLGPEVKRRAPGFKRLGQPRASHPSQSSSHPRTLGRAKEEPVCLTIWVLLAGHKGEDRLGVVIGLLLAGGARVLPVVCQLVDTPQVADGVTAREIGKSVLAKGNSLVPGGATQKPLKP